METKSEALIFHKLIKAGFLTPLEYSKFGQKLVLAYHRLSFDEQHNKDNNLRHLLELFCEGLGENPKTLIQGKAINALEDFLIQRKMERKLTLKTHNQHYRDLCLFSSPPIGIDWQPKVRAALALINVLKQKPGCGLSKEDIDNLSTSYFPEDNLAKLVKTNLLGPLGINDLSELSLATVEEVKPLHL